MMQSAKHQSGNSPANKGFTIAEALIAIILFTITLSGGLAIYVNADRIVTLATHKRLAIELANSKMEDLREKDYDEVVSLPQETVNIGDLSGFREVTADVFSDYKEVTSTVPWPEASEAEPREVEIKTIIAP